jgi:tetratricopeptide (TPR) repeat protein
MRARHRRFGVNPAARAASVVALALAGCAARNSLPAASPRPAARSSSASAQLSAEQKQVVFRGMQLTDAGRLDEAIAYFSKCHAEHPRVIVYAHELALAYERRGDHRSAIQVLEPYASRADFGPRSAALLGSAYDEAGMPRKSLDLFERAIVRFPSSGTLYTNAGVTEIGEHHVARALQYFERGIQRDPRHSTNYYYAALVESHAGERVWAAVYGEAFMNLERNSQRTREISALLYDVYTSAVRVGRDANGRADAQVQFTKRAVSATPGQAGLKLPFEVCYTIAMTPKLALGAVDAAKHGQPLSVDALHAARAAFLDVWFSKEHFDRRYPSSLFDWQRKLAAEGRLAAYDHWLFMQGAPRDFVAWRQAHAAEFASFASWFEAHPMPVDAHSVLSRLSYGAPGPQTARVDRSGATGLWLAWK